MIEQFRTDDLKRLLKEEVGSKDFAPGYLASVAALVKKDPASYLGFGPYWPSLKNQLVDAGLLSLSKEEDGSLLSSLPDDLLCAAAYAWSEHSHKNGATYTSAHTVVDSEGELTTVHTEDPEIEGLIASKQIANAL